MTDIERECRTALRLVALAAGPRVSRQSYRVWRAEQVTPWPSAEAITEVLGPWGEALRRVGAHTRCLEPAAGTRSRQLT